MTGAGTLPSGEEPEGALSYGSLEDFSLLTGADFIIQLVNQITFAATGYTNLQDALEKIASQIGFPEFSELLLAAFEGITGSLLNFLPWFINLTDLLGFDLNINPDDFNPVSVAIGIVERFVEMLGLGNLLDLLGLNNIFGDLFGIFGGSDSASGAGNFIENLLSLFDLSGGALTGSPGSFNPAAILTDWVENLLNPLELLAPFDLFDDLSTQFNQITDILSGAIVTPINGVISAIKDWFDSFFGGGSDAGIPLTQKGAANGVAPLNASTKINTTYIPDLSATYIATSEKNVNSGVCGLDSGGKVSVLRLPDAALSHVAPSAVISVNDSVADDDDEVLTGLDAGGSSLVIFEDGSNTRFQLDAAGTWQFVVNVSFNSTGVTEVSLLADGGGFHTNQALGISGRDTYSNTVAMFDVVDDEWFSISAWQNAGGPETIDVQIIALYLGVTAA